MHCVGFIYSIEVGSSIAVQVCLLQIPVLVFVELIYVCYNVNYCKLYSTLVSVSVFCMSILLWLCQCLFVCMFVCVKL